MFIPKGFFYGVKDMSWNTINEGNGGLMLAVEVLHSGTVNFWIFSDTLSLFLLPVLASSEFISRVLAF